MQNQTFSRGERNIILTVLVLGSLFASYSQSAVNVAIPSIGTDLGLSGVLASWVSTAFVLSASCFLVPMGKVADIYGRKKLYLIAIIIFTSGSIIAPFSNSAAMLIGVRIYQGIGAAIINLNAMSIASSVFPAEERGRALGFVVASVYFGVSVGPFVGGLLTEHLGWQSVFWLLVPLGLFVIVLMLWKFKGEWKEEKQGRFDVVGSVIFAAALIALTYGASRLPAAYALGLMIAGVFGLGLFLWWESRVGSPVLPVNLFRNNHFYLFSNLAALVNYSATVSISLLLSFYLQYIKGLNPFTAGLVMITMPVVQVVVSPIAGRMSDKIEPRLLATAGMALDACGLLYLGFVNFDTNLPLLLGVLAVMGFGFGLFSSPNANAIMGAVEPKYYGAASATQGVMRQLGATISLALTTLMIALFIGSSEIVPANYEQLLSAVRITFYISSGLAFASIFFSLNRGKAVGHAKVAGH